MENFLNNKTVYKLFGLLFGLLIVYFGVFHSFVTPFRVNENFFVNGVIINILLLLAGFLICLGCGMTLSKNEDLNFFGEAILELTFGTSFLCFGITQWYTSIRINFIPFPAPSSSILAFCVGVFLVVLSIKKIYIFFLIYDK